MHTRPHTARGLPACYLITAHPALTGPISRGITESRRRTQHFEGEAVASALFACADRRATERLYNRLRLVLVVPSAPHLHQRVDHARAPSAPPTHPCNKAGDRTMRRDRPARLSPGPAGMLPRHGQSRASPRIPRAQPRGVRPRPSGRPGPDPATESH